MTSKSGHLEKWLPRCNHVDMFFWGVELELVQITRVKVSACKIKSHLHNKVLTPGKGQILNSPNSCVNIYSYIHSFLFHVQANVSTAAAAGS